MTNLNLKIQKEQDKKIVDALVSNGDGLWIKREINYWFYFKTSAKRKEFKDCIAQFHPDFKCVDDEYYVTGDDYKYGLILKRFDSVNLDSAINITEKYGNLAITFDGYYDGWETRVVSLMDSDKSQEGRK